MTTHTLYSASSLDRLALCPPSARLGKDIPDTSSKDAERGTRIHAAGEALLLGDPVDGLDDEEYQIAKLYAEYVWDVAGDEGVIHVEAEFHKELGVYNENFGGTADAVVVLGRNLHIIDLKSGRTPVQSKDNKQMLTYALGAWDRYGRTNFDFIHLHIFQPSNVSTIVYGAERMLRWVEELVVIGERADDPFEKPNPSAKACHFCKAKTVCPAMREKVLENAKQDFAENSLEKLLDDAKLAITWAETIQEQAKQAILDGKDAGKWTLKNGRKMISYKDKVGAEAYFAENVQAFELKSPSALKKIGIEVPEQYLEEKVSAPSLTRKE